MRGFVGTIAGGFFPTEFFGVQNVERIMAHAGPAVPQWERQT